MTYSEENYLKVIYHLSLTASKGITTNSIANVMESKPSSVTDMVQKLADKDLITYKKYQGVSLTEKGRLTALMIVRKHRLWEVFLVDKLDFSWDEVHDVAEQLEHIKSEKLIDKLDEFLDFPTEDPHGDPIPDENGEFKEKPKVALSQTSVNQSGIIVAVKDTSSLFLQYIDKLGAYLGAKVKVLDKVEFDGSMELLIDGKKNIFISREVAENILITE